MAALCAQPRQQQAQPQSHEKMVTKAGRLLDVRTGGVAYSRSILIEGDRITQVGANLAAPAGARTIDLSAYTVLQGPHR